MVINLFLRQHRQLFIFTANNIFKRNLCSAVSARSVSKNYEYLLILDLEATCEESKKRTKPYFQEIIEFPCIKFNINTLCEEGRFHQYVRPVFKPTLSYFCVELTGILQEVVDQAKTFSEVYDMFEEWRTKEALTQENSLYVTSGDWDLGHMIPEQCALSNKEIPSHMKIWADIKKVFGHNSNHFYSSFSEILYHYNLQFEGRKHSGIDDCLNMVRVVKKMRESGIIFEPTSRLINNRVESVYSTLKEQLNKNMRGPCVINSTPLRKRR